MIGGSTAQRRVARAWVVALAAGVLAAQMASIAHRALPGPAPLEELTYYPSGQHVRAAALGYPDAAADLAWLRAVQYYGEHRKSDNRFVKMEHIFDILTTLAPRFTAAYVFGAFALAQEGDDFPAAERLMHKGLELNPRSGRLAFEMGFLYYVRPGGRELVRASEYFEQASRQPDGPPQSARFAAFTRQHSGNLAVSYELWTQVYENSGNPALREMAEREMRRIRRAQETGRTEIAVQPLPTPRVLIRH